jgi:cell wall-associated NlpC family hydrolase
VWLFEALAGLMSKAKLDELTSDKAAVAGSLTTTADLPTLGQSRESADDQVRSTMVAFMRANVGDAYVFAAEIADGEADPKAGDCSEYMEAMHHRGGLAYPDGCVNQKAFMRGRRVAQPRPGDVFFYGPNARGIPHTGMYEGGGSCIHALGGKGVVRQAQAEVESHPRFEGWWRHPDLAWPKEERA